MTIRVLVLCFIAACIAAVAVGLLYTAPAGDPFDQWLATIETNQDSSETLKNAEQYLAFLSDALAGQIDPAVQRQQADRYFRLGQALFAHKTPERLSQAVQQFNQAVKLHPSLRHGWPYFLGAEAYERRGDDQQAIRWYEQAAQHDYGQLAIDARYRIALIEVRQPAPPAIGPRPVYDFIRFVANAPFEEIKTFRGASWRDEPEAAYLNALALWSDGESDSAIREMKGYARLRPNDPSAQYHLDVMQKWNHDGMHPADGDLLHSFIAPRAFDDNGPVIKNNAELISDFYFHTPPETVELFWEFQAPNAPALTWTICLNGECTTVSYLTTSSISPSGSVSSGSIRAAFDNVKQRNHVVIQPVLSPAPNEDAHNRVRLIQFKLIEASPVAASPVETAR